MSITRTHRRHKGADFRLGLLSILLESARHIDAEGMKDRSRLPDVLGCDAARDEDGFRDARNLPRRFLPSERRPCAARRTRDVTVHEDDLGGIGISSSALKSSP